jgi:hypothetical protein
MKDVTRRENGRGLANMMLCADLDDSIAGVADDAGTSLPGTKPNQGDLRTGVDQ